MITTHHTLTTGTIEARSSRCVRTDGRPGRTANRPSRMELIVLALIVAVLIVGAAWPQLTRTRDVPTSVVRVEAGQTLWNLAQEHPVSGLTTQQTADLIASLNGIEGTLSAGSTVRVPQEPQLAVAMR